MKGKISLIGKPEYQRDDLIARTERTIHDIVEQMYNAIPQLIRSRRQRLLIFNVGGLEAARVSSNLGNVHYRILHPEERFVPENFPMQRTPIEN